MAQATGTAGTELEHQDCTQNLLGPEELGEGNLQ